jgi:MSHA biogenesis protein MshO
MSKKALSGQRAAKGFTLIELVIVMVLMGILASTFMVFFMPTIKGYFDARRRADLTDVADTALRKLNLDIRRAIPNSLNLIDASTAGDALACFQLVPSVGGGRYRLGPDTVNDAATCATNPLGQVGICSRYPDNTDLASAAQVFDVLSSTGQAPVVGDAVVINNQNGGDVYLASGGSRAQITAVAAPTNVNFGELRLTIASNPTATGYAGGRYSLVSQAERSVIYSCSGGKLYRNNPGTFVKANTCPTTGDLLATDVKSCDFMYDANIGGTQQSGFLWVSLVLEREGEAIRMESGSHVDNQP